MIMKKYGFVCFNYPYHKYGFCMFSNHPFGTGSVHPKDSIRDLNVTQINIMRSPGA